MGPDLDGGESTGTGFVLSTRAAWQSLCEEVVRRALPGFRALAQHPVVSAKRATLDVIRRPDISVVKRDVTELLLDATYETRQHGSHQLAAQISTSPWPSSELARPGRLRPTGCRRPALLDPMLSSTPVLPPLDRLRQRRRQKHDPCDD